MDDVKSRLDALATSNGELQAMVRMLLDETERLHQMLLANDMF